MCYNIQQPKALKREVDALVEASLELNCPNLVVITWDKEEQIEMNQLTINLIPAYRWLIQDLNN